MTDAESWLIDDIAITIIRSARRRTLSIEVGADGVKARAPLYMRRNSIVQFVQTKRAWIERHLSELPAPKPPFEFRHGAVVHLYDQTRKIHIIEVQSSRASITVDTDCISIPIKKSHLPIEESARRKLVKYLKAEIKAELNIRVLRYAKQINVPENKKLSVHVRDYKRRWGSCDHLGQLSFNWRIISAPNDVIDYVVIHELAHCHEFNHSRRFWRIVETHMPDWKSKQQWLHLHGATLYQL